MFMHVFPAILKQSMKMDRNPNFSNNFYKIHSSMELFHTFHAVLLHDVFSGENGKGIHLKMSK